MDTLGLDKSEAITANTFVVRANQEAKVNGRKIYAYVNVRRALTMARDNAGLFKLGHAGLDEEAQNHHVRPIQAEYARIEDPVYAPEGALKMMEAAGVADVEHELVSLDSGFQRDTCDAVAALRDAGIGFSRTILPGTSYWKDWNTFIFSGTEWNIRPLGVQCRRRPTNRELPGTRRASRTKSSTRC